MAYCEYLDVKAIVDTKMEDDDIMRMIDETDAFMDLKLDTGSLGALVLRAISRTWTAYRVMLKDPDSTGIGSYSYSRATALRLLKEEYTELMGSADGITLVVAYDEIN